MAQRPPVHPPHPNRIDFDLARVTACLRSDGTGEVIETELKELDKDPDQSHASFLLGYIYLKRGDLVPAQKSLEKAYGQGPLRPEYALYLGRAYCLAGKLQQAAEMYKAAAILSPNNPLIEVYQGDLLNQQDDSQGALAHYQKALSLDPESPIVHTALAMTYGRREEAGLSYYHIGMAAKYTGQYLKALFYFEKALKVLDPESPQAKETASEILLMEG